MLRNAMLTKELLLQAIGSWTQMLNCCLLILRPTLCRPRSSQFMLKSEKFRMSLIMQNNSARYFIKAFCNLVIFCLLSALCVRPLVKSCKA